VCSSDLIELDKEKNQHLADFQGIIQKHQQGIAILVIPTQEELAIALACKKLLID
jgi:acetate kinase